MPFARFEIRHRINARTVFVYTRKHLDFFHCCRVLRMFVVIFDIQRVHAAVLFITLQIRLRKRRLDTETRCKIFVFQYGIFHCRHFAVERVRGLRRRQPSLPVTVFVGKAGIYQNGISYITASRDIVYAFNRVHFQRATVFFFGADLHCKFDRSFPNVAFAVRCGEFQRIFASGFESIFAVDHRFVAVRVDQRLGYRHVRTEYVFCRKFKRLRRPFIDRFGKFARDYGFYVVYVIDFNHRSVFVVDQILRIVLHLGTQRKFGIFPVVIGSGDLGVERRVFLRRFRLQYVAVFIHDVIIYRVNEILSHERREIHIRDRLFLRSVQVVLFRKFVSRLRHVQSGTHVVFHVAVVERRKFIFADVRRRIFVRNVPQAYERTGQIVFQNVDKRAADRVLAGIFFRVFVKLGTFVSGNVRQTASTRLFIFKTVLFIFAEKIFFRQRLVGGNVIVRHHDNAEGNFDGVAV